MTQGTFEVDAEPHAVVQLGAGWMVARLRSRQPGARQYVVMRLFGNHMRGKVLTVFPDDDDLEWLWDTAEAVEFHSWPIPPRLVRDPWH